MTYKTENTRISLKAIKYNARASHETHCYQAKVYFGSRHVANVHNDGHGGGDVQFPVDRAAFAQMLSYITQLPPVGHYHDGTPMDDDLEMICCDLVNKHLRELKASIIARREKHRKPV